MRTDYEDKLRENLDVMITWLDNPENTTLKRRYIETITEAARRFENKHKYTDRCLCEMYDDQAEIAMSEYKSEKLALIVKQANARCPRCGRER